MTKYIEDILDFDQGSPEELYNLYMSSEKHAALFKQNIIIGKNVNSFFEYLSLKYLSHSSSISISLSPSNI